MDKIEKILRKMSRKDRKQVEAIMKKILFRDFTGVRCEKLKNYKSLFRIRIGNYRVIYFDDGNDIELKGIKRRNETTYRDL